MPKDQFFSEITAGIKPVIAYPKPIEFGPIAVDGFMLENGDFRQSITSTGRSIGGDNKMTWLVKAELKKLLAAESTPGDQGQNLLEASQANGNLVRADRPSSPWTDDSPLVLPVRCPGVAGHANIAYTISLVTVVQLWKQVATGDSKFAQQCLELLGLSAIHSLERVYQEAFGVDDARNSSDRLVEWAIRMDAGKHFPLFGGQFHKHFARVTGVTIGHQYAAACLADLVYHRLPEPIYETLKDLNPVTETGFRQFTHSQLMTDDMHQQMREIVATVTHELANTPSKAEDMTAYRKCLHRLDVTMPRYRKRGANPGVFPPQFKARHEALTEQRRTEAPVAAGS